MVRLLSYLNSALILFVFFFYLISIFIHAKLLFSFFNEMLRRKQASCSKSSSTFFKSSYWNFQAMMFCFDINPSSMPSINLLAVSSYAMHLHSVIVCVFMNESETRTNTPPAHISSQAQNLCNLRRHQSTMLNRRERNFALLPQLFNNFWSVLCAGLWVDWPANLYTPLKVFCLNSFY